MAKRKKKKYDLKILLIVGLIAIFVGGFMGYVIKGTNSVPNNDGYAIEDYYITSTIYKAEEICNSYSYSLKGFEFNDGYEGGALQTNLYCEKADGTELALVWNGVPYKYFTDEYGNLIS